MRVLIDTNVLISAALSANGVPYQAYVKAASYPNHGLICEQNVDEMKRIFNKKFPKRLAALDKFLSIALLTLELVPIPTDENTSESQVRDADDRPILRAAIAAKADVLLTGDKEHLLQRILRIPFHSQVVQDQKAVIVKGRDKHRPVLGKHPGQPVQDRGDIRHEYRYVLVDQGIGNTSGKEGFSRTHVTEKQKAGILPVCLLPVFHIGTGFFRS